MKVEVQPALKNVKNCFFAKKAAALIEADAIQALNDGKYLVGVINTVIDGTAGEILIHLGVRNLAPQFVEKLLQWKANPNLTNDLSETCLHILLDSEQYSNKQFKYDKKERKYTVNGEQRIEIGVTERDAAIKSEKEKRMEILEILFAEKNVKLNPKNTINLPNKKKEKETPLAITIRRGLAEEGKFLLEHGALVTEENIKVAEKQKDLNVDFLRALQKRFEDQTYSNVTRQLKQESTSQIFSSTEVTTRGRANTITKRLPISDLKAENNKTKAPEKRVGSKSVDAMAKKRLDGAVRKNNDLINNDELPPISQFVKAKVTVIPAEKVRVIPTVAIRGKQEIKPQSPAKPLNASSISQNKQLNSEAVKNKPEIKPVASSTNTSYFRK